MHPKKPCNYLLKDKRGRGREGERERVREGRREIKTNYKRRRAVRRQLLA